MSDPAFEGPPGGETPGPAPEPGPGPAPEVEAAPYEASSEQGPVFEAGSKNAPPPPPGAGDTTWATACHLSALLSFVVTSLVGVLVPLGIWYLLRRDDARVERAAKESFNFQVNVLLWGAVGALLTLTCILAPIGLPIVLAALIVNLVFPIVAALETSGGKDYRYPFIIRFLD